MQNIVTYNYAKLFLSHYNKPIENLILELEQLHAILSPVYVKLRLMPKDIVDLLQESNIDEIIKNILILMMNNKIIYILPDVIVSIQNIYYTSNNFDVSYLKTYKLLNKKNIHNLENLLQNKFNKKNIKIIQIVSPELLWGFVISIYKKTINFSGDCLLKKIQNI